MPHPERPTFATFAPLIALVAMLGACSGGGAGPADEPDLSRIEGTVMLEGFGPLPDAIVRVRRVGRETYFLPTDAQGTFSHEGESDYWEVSVVGTDGFSGSDSETLFVSADQTITFEAFVVQRLVYDVEIRDGVAIPYQTEVGAYAMVRWTNFDAEPHSIRFQHGGPPMRFPTSPPLATGEQFEWPFDSQESASSTHYECSLHPGEFGGNVLVDWDPS